MLLTRLSLWLHAGASACCAHSTTWRTLGGCRLVEIRTCLEKIRPIDKQMAYQVRNPCVACGCMRAPACARGSAAL